MSTAMLTVSVADVRKTWEEGHRERVRQFVRERAQLVCAALSNEQGSEWRITECHEDWGDGGVYYLSDGDVSLSLSINVRHVSKFRLSAIVPKDAEYDAARKYTCEIGASLDKMPNQLARDIVRRLLPDARRMYAFANDRRREREENERRKSRILDQLVAASGGERHRSESVQLNSYSPSGHAEFNPEYSGETASVKLLSAPLELALQLAAVIRTWNATHHAVREDD